MFLDMDVVGFSLVDAENDIYLFDINNGDTLDFDVLEATYGTEQFTIVCNTTGPVESTILSDPYRGENAEGTAPWALSGDDGLGDFFPTPFRDNAGNWNVTCQPFCGPGQTGAAGAAEFVNFDITFRDCTVCQEGCIFITGKPEPFVYKNGALCAVLTSCLV